MFPVWYCFCSGTEFLDDYVYLEKDVRAHQEEAAATKEIDRM